MVHFFIESKNEFTPEYVFLGKYIKKIRPDLYFDIIPMDGIGNLFNNSITTMMRLHLNKQEKNVVVVDIDFPNQHYRVPNFGNTWTMETEYTSYTRSISTSVTSSSVDNCMTPLDPNFCKIATDGNSS